MSLPARRIVPVALFLKLSSHLKFQRSILRNFSVTHGFRRRAMSVVVNGIEGDLDRVSRLLDAQLEDCLSVEEIFVRVFAGPIWFGREPVECGCSRD